MRLVEQSSTHQWLGLKTSPPSSSIPALYCWWLLLLNSDIYVAGAMGRPKGLNTGFRDTSRRSGAALRVWLACVSLVHVPAKRRRRHGSVLGRFLPSLCIWTSPRTSLLVHGRNTPYSPTLEHIKGGYLASLYSSRPTVFRASAVLLNPGRHIQGELCWVRARRWQGRVDCGIDLIVCRFGSDCRRVLLRRRSSDGSEKGGYESPPISFVCLAAALRQPAPSLRLYELRAGPSTACSWSCVWTQSPSIRTTHPPRLPE